MNSIYGELYDIMPFAFGTKLNPTKKSTAKIRPTLLQGPRIEDAGDARNRRLTCPGPPSVAQEMSEIDV